MIAHGVAGSDGLMVAEGFEILFSADESYGCPVDGEGGAEHGGAEFVAVGAMADEAR